MWAEFVVVSPCSAVFLPPQKPTFPNSIWNQWTKSQSVEMPLQNSNLFILLILFKIEGKRRTKATFTAMRAAAARTKNVFKKPQRRRKVCLFLL